MDGRNAEYRYKFFEPNKKLYREVLYNEILDLVARHSILSDYDKWYVLNLVRYKFREVNKK